MCQYDIDLATVDPSTSHGQMIELVGYNKEVLDVGCATGYLARALVARGCRVSGVELDAEAAEDARPVLERVVVGDLSALDLVAEFGAGTFDVLVFGDVLEHLTDPLTVLRRAVPLLRPGGSVVVSVPNITHAAVRLSLLKGEFEYRELGLLDRTHVHFFTRESLRRTVREAGLVPVDIRRTTAGFFETEIRVDPADVDPALVERLRQDPDSDTYQFVLRAVRADAVHDADDLPRRYEELEVDLIMRRRELDQVRAELDHTRNDLEGVRAAEAHVRRQLEEAHERIGTLERAFAHAGERMAQMEEWLRAPRFLARRFVGATRDRVLGNRGVGH